MSSQCLVVQPDRILVGCPTCSLTIDKIVHKMTKPLNLWKISLVLNDYMNLQNKIFCRFVFGYSAEYGVCSSNLQNIGFCRIVIRDPTGWRARCGVQWTQTGKSSTRNKAAELLMRLFPYIKIVLKSFFWLIFAEKHMTVYLHLHWRAFCIISKKAKTMYF